VRSVGVHRIRVFSAATVTALFSWVFTVQAQNVARDHTDVVYGMDDPARPSGFDLPIMSRKHRAGLGQ
jgi:hypothetical protein